MARFQDNCDLPSADEAAQAWHHVSTPSEVWEALVQQDINDAWSTWFSDAEVFLKRIGAVSHESSAGQRGSLPTLVSGPSRHGPGQSITERRLRRVIRRLDEAQRHVHNGTSVPTNLQRTCQRNCNQFGCGADAQAHRWGACLKELTEQLKFSLKQSNLHALQGWRQKVQTYEGACAWLRKQAPPSWALTNGDKNTSGRSQGAAFLFESWKNIFCGPEGYEPKAEPFVQAYAAWIPHNPELVTPELTAQGLKDTVRQMRRKAAGPDQWSAEALLLLPDMAWERLTELLLQVEQVGKWPAPLVQWRLTFLPKVSADKTGVTHYHVAKVRPIAIGSLIYRAWSKHRFAQISPGMVGLLLGGCQALAPK